MKKRFIEYLLESKKPLKESATSDLYEKKVA